MTTLSLDLADIRSMDSVDYDLFRAAAKWDRTKAWIVTDREKLLQLRDTLAGFAEPLVARKGDGPEARGQRLLGATYLRIVAAINEGLGVS